jgi:hypothetical protein
MTVIAPLDLCRQFIELVIPGLTVIESGDPEPGAPRPDVDEATPSYAAFEIQSDESAWATAYEETTDTPSGAKVEQLRALPTDGVLAVEFYGPLAGDYARSLRLSHGRADVLMLLEAAGDFAIDNPSGVSDDPVLRSARRELGASVTFGIRWVDSEIYDTEGVDTITTTVSVVGE